MDKLKLFEVTFKKLSGDKTFMAYYLQRAIADENITPGSLAQWLDCSMEDFYKLALCKAPELNSPGFHERLEKIAAYSNTPVTALQNIISGPALNHPEKPKSRLLEAFERFTEKITLPAWLTATPQLVVCQAAMLLCIILFTFRNPKTRSLGLYISHYTAYTDSTQHLQLSDNTCVYKNKL